MGVQAESTLASLVQMGFPQRARVEASTYFCAGTGGEFVCPRCKGRVAELPGECPVCRLTLVSSPHLARSYHHLFPVPPFEEASAPEGDAAPVCYGCGDALRGEEGAARGVVLRCPRCVNLFCFSCDNFVHEALHNCPGCECAPEAAA
jgi:transcription initiation factor TFIIH subunit 2